MRWNTVFALAFLTALPVDASTVPLQGQFRVDEQGAATYQLPLELPKARGNVAPHMAFSYASSNRQDGYLGVGFSLSAQSMITRCPQSIATDRALVGVGLTDSDRFCLDGQRLVLARNSPADYGEPNSTYRTEIESYQKITARGRAEGGGPLAFKVEGKDGDVRYFGNPQLFGKTLKDSNGATVGPDSMRFANNRQRQTVALFWAQSGTVDAFGNYISFRYERDGSKGEHYLSSVSYGGHNHEIPYQHVKLSYSARPNVSRGYSSGILIGINKLLRHIEIFTDGELLSRYSLSYEEATNHTKQNRLVSVRRCIDTTSSNCTTPIEFSWNTSSINANSSPLFGSSVLESASVANRHTARLFDMTGNGLADMVYSSGSAWKLHNFETNQAVNMGSTGASHPQNAHVINFSGRGQRDLLVSNGANSNWQILTYEPSTQEVPRCSGDRLRVEDGLAEANEMREQCEVYRRTTYYRSIPTGRRAIGWDGNVLIADPDGDGLEDILFTQGNAISWYRNEGGRFSPARILLAFPSASPVSGAGWMRSTLRNSALLDFNGDGRTDLFLRVDEGRCLASNGRYIPGVGAGECLRDLINATWTWVSSTRLYISMGTSYVERQTIDDIYDSTKVHVADFNGDGLTDIAYAKNNKWYARVSNGYQLNSPIDTGISTNNSNATKTYFFDANFDGKSDIVTPGSRQPNGREKIHFFISGFNTNGNLNWSYKGNRYIADQETLHLADTEGYGIPQIYSASATGWYRYNSYVNYTSNTISQIKDGFSVRTIIEYARLTDKQDGKYTVYPVQSSTVEELSEDSFGLLAPMMVVKRVSTETNVNRFVSVRYEYGGLALNRLGRGFLGFEILTTIDEQTEIETTTQYHQQFPLTGLPSSTSQFFNGELLNSSTSDYEFGVSPHASQSRFAHLTSSFEAVRELANNGTVYKVSHKKTTTEYDEYGNAKNITVIERHPNNGTILLTTVTTNQYAGAGGGAEKGRLSHTRVTKNRPGVPSVSRTSAFRYSSLGILVESTLAPGESLYEVKTQYEYDNYGNKVSESVTAGTNWNGREKSTRTTRQSWGETGRYIDYQQNNAGERITYRYNGLDTDSVRGRVTTVSTTDPNGRVSSISYDVWGREYQVRKPNGDNSTNIYHLCGTCNYVVGGHHFFEQLYNGKPARRIVFDKFGRKVAEAKRHFDGNWVVSQTVYDDSGRPIINTEPGITRPSNYATELTYDIHSRVIEQQAPHGARTTTSYTGRTIQVTDDKGYQRTTILSGLGEKARVEDELGSLIIYRYDAYGNLTSVAIDSESKPRITRSSSRFDKYGRKYQTTDLDKGTWNYQFNAFGELISQTNAMGQVVSFEYDALGRRIKRTEPEGVTCWIYGNAVSKTAGLMVEEKQMGTGERNCNSNNTRSKKTFEYFNNGLLRRTQVRLDGHLYTIGYTYDSFGRVQEITYPDNQVKVRNVYNTNGYLIRQEDPISGEVYVTINQMDARGNVVSASYGNGVVENRDFKERSGFIESILLRKNNSTLHDLSYQFDLSGNLIHRSMNLSSASLDWTDNYRYDELYRLTQYSTTYTGEVSGSVQSVSYDDIGNIISKSDVGTYRYSSTNPYRLSRVEYVSTALPDPVPRNPVAPTPPSPVAPTPPNPITLPPVPIMPIEPVELRPRPPGGLPSLPVLPPSELLSGSVDGITGAEGNVAIALRGMRCANCEHHAFVGEISVNQGNSNTVFKHFSYDENGNIIDDGIRQYQYTSYDLIKKIEQGQEFSRYEYDINRNRYYRFDRRMENGSPVFYATTYVEGLYEKIVRTGSDVTNLTEHKFYVGNIIITKRSNGSSSRYVLHKDHQGSTTTVTDQSGRVVQQFVYDAWGKMLQTHITSLLGVAVSPAFNNGYTGHEQLSHLNIIHMKGRIYDPTLGRFLQADPHIQAPDNLQNYNRYSYVMNNPMSYTDPSGFFFKKIGKLFKKYWKSIVAVVATVVTYGAASGWVAGWGATWGTAATATSAATLTTAGAVATGALAGAAGGAIGGALMTGSLRGALRGAFAGAIAGAAGGYANFGSVSGLKDAAQRVAVSALGGCGAGRVSGGSCSRGAQFAAIAQMASLSFDHMAKVTDKYKLRSCGLSNSICDYNKWGELLTDGGRGELQIEGTQSGNGNFLTNSGMASEASGKHLYSENSWLGRYVNRVSKVHDYLNSDVSKIFGFHGYDYETGLWLSGTETYNTMFQVYSFSGMLPAAMYTNLSLISSYPVYSYLRLEGQG